MAKDDIDPEEIELLLKALAAPPKAPPKPSVTPAVTNAPISTSTSSVSPPAATHRNVRPGWRWTNVRLLMPAARRERRQLSSFMPAIKTPALPEIAFSWLTEMPPSAMSARVFVSLGVMLSAAMPHWPYAHAWSWGLLVYFAAVMLVVVTGIWSAKLTWDERLPAAHTVALGVVMWGVGLLAAETVPRIAYA